MKKIEYRKMQVIVAGDSCSTATGFMCAATTFLLFAGPLAPLAGATGTGCAIGLAACKIKP